MSSRFRNLSDDTPKTADVCVIGGGVAGLTLARALRGAGIHALVFESGGLYRTKYGDALNTGRNIGPHPFQIGGRRRVLGGALNDWGANCAFLEADDFEALPIHSGINWPVTHSQLARFEGAAAQVLGFERSDQGTSTETAISSNGLRRKHYARGRAGAEHLLSGWSRSVDSASVVLNATFVRFVAPTDTEIHQAEFVDASGQSRHVAAKVFVMACGADNSGNLLRGLPWLERIPDRWPALGRYLHAHLILGHGFVVPKGGFDPQQFALSGLDGDNGVNRRNPICGLQITPECRRADSLLNGAMFLAPLATTSALVHRTTRSRARRIGLRSETSLAESLGMKIFQRRNASGPLDYVVQHFLEQPARAGSVATLGAKAGPLNLPEVEVHWSIGAAERRTIIENCNRLDRWLSALGFGNVITAPIEDGRDFVRNAHPMGGTIMGSDPRTSVVDADCRLHGLKNLYVLGGSVVPRIGAAMLTGVIVQLALRLAENLSLDAPNWR